MTAGDDGIESVSTEVQRDLRDTMTRVLGELNQLGERNPESEVIDFVVCSMMERAVEVGMRLYEARIAAGDVGAESELNKIMDKIERDYLDDRRN